MSNIAKIKEDLQLLKEDLTAYGAGLVDDTVQLGADVKEHLAQKLNETTQQLKDINDRIADETVHLVKEVNTTIKNKPYHTAGIALVIGTCIGILLGRRE